MKKTNFKNMNVRDIILMICSILFIIAGVIALIIAIFGKGKSNLPLTIALACTFISNLLNYLRSSKKKK